MAVCYVDCAVLLEHTDSAVVIVAMKPAFYTGRNKRSRERRM